MTKILYKGHTFAPGVLDYFTRFKVLGAIGTIGQEHLRRSGRFVLDDAQVEGANELWERVVVLEKAKMEKNGVEFYWEVRLE